MQGRKIKFISYKTVKLATQWCKKPNLNKFEEEKYSLKFARKKQIGHRVVQKAKPEQSLRNKKIV